MLVSKDDEEWTNLRVRKKQIKRIKLQAIKLDLKMYEFVDYLLDNQKK